MLMTGLTEEEKVKQARERRWYMDEIRKADFFSVKKQSVTAISEYIALLEKLPWDQSLLRKIAKIYSNSKDWSRAYEYYIQIPFDDLSSDEKSDYITTLLFDESSQDRYQVISSLPLPPHDRAYYKTIDTCHTGIHNCIVTILAYSGSESRLTSLKELIHGYEKVSPDLHYRNLLVATKLFEQGQYRASMVLAEEIYTARPDYKEVLKLLGFSRYRMGKYEQAAGVLRLYLDSHPKDPEVIVTLGDIALELGDYALANTYYNTAISTPYSPKILLERKLAYSYLMLDDEAGMIKVMWYLLQREESTEDDAIVWGSIAVMIQDTLHAQAWLNAGIKKFPESSLLYTLRAELFLEAKKYTEATTDLAHALELAPTNTRAQKTWWKILIETNRLDDARLVLDSLREKTKDESLLQEVENLLQQITEKEALIQSGSSQIK